VIRSEAPVRTLRGSARPPHRYANYTHGFWHRICHLGKTPASTGIVAMALAAFEQYVPRRRTVIDDGWAAERPYARGENALRREGVIPVSIEASPNGDRSRRWPGATNALI
jgi:hypothetical protein